MATTSRTADGCRDLPESGNLKPSKRAMSIQLPDPHLAQVYLLEATLGQPQEFAGTAQVHRCIVPLTGGPCIGPRYGVKRNSVEIMRRCSKPSSVV